MSRHAVLIVARPRPKAMYQLTTQDDAMAQTLVHTLSAHFAGVPFWNAVFLKI